MVAFFVVNTEDYFKKGYQRQENDAPHTPNYAVTSYRTMPAILPKLQHTLP